QKEYDYLNYLGVKWTLLTFNWNRIEHEKDMWDFQYYDELVDRANEAGIKIIGVLGYGNQHILNASGTNYYIPPDSMPYFLEYARRTAEHFRGRIGAWCIWNEPNGHFWKGTDTEFFELTRRTADTIRGADSDVTLLGGAFNRGVFGLPKKYIQGLFESGAMKNIDLISFHPYELNPARSARLYDKFKKIAVAYGYGDKIWATEMGYPTGGTYPTKIPESKLNAYVIKTYVLLAARNTRGLVWYQLFDPVYRRRTNSEDYFGLIRSREDYTSKGAEAFRLCATYLPGTKLNFNDLIRENIPTRVETYYFNSNETNVLVLWNNSLFPIKIHITLPGTDHILHNPVTGGTAAIQANTELRVTGEPIFITWQGNGPEPAFIKR
ncbi:MAG: beta-galactosidase, partial [Treponema sp.]|nr:beta-galactosidase [Treponema sp.]